MRATSDRTGEASMTAARASNMNGSKSNGSESFDLVRVDEVEAELVDWLWENRLARGKLTLLGSLPGLGKSQIAVDVAARMTRQAHWPNGPRAPVGCSIFICSEDDIGDTIRPRLEAAGADLTMVHVLLSTFTKDGKRKTFNLQNDLDVLARACARVGNVALVCFDALTSYMGKIDNASTTDVRAVLEPVGDFAKELGVAVLGITHPPKAHQANALHSFTGSLAYVAAARFVFCVTEEVGTDRKLLLSAKNNLGPLPPGIGYTIGTQLVSNGIIAPHVIWDDAPVDMTANEALAAASAALKDGGAVERAKDFLRGLLASGPVDANEGEEAAKAHGISARTLDRARSALGVKANKDGYQGAWCWKLPV
jgi:hypothetical protein